MGGDDLQVGEVGGDVVEQDGSGVPELDATATGEARTQASGAGVEQDRDAEPGGGLVHRVAGRIVGGVALRRRMELQAPEAELGDGTAQLIDRSAPLAGID